MIYAVYKNVILIIFPHFFTKNKKFLIFNLAVSETLSVCFSLSGCFYHLVFIQETLCRILAFMTKTIIVIAASNFFYCYSMNKIWIRDKTLNQYFYQNLINLANQQQIKDHRRWLWYCTLLGLCFDNLSGYKGSKRWDWLC